MVTVHDGSPPVVVQPAWSPPLPHAEKAQPRAVLARGSTMTTVPSLCSLLVAIRLMISPCRRIVRSPLPAGFAVVVSV